MKKMLIFALLVISALFGAMTEAWISSTDTNKAPPPPPPPVKVTAPSLEEDTFGWIEHIASADPNHNAY